MHSRSIALLASVLAGSLLPACAAQPGAPPSGSAPVVPSATRRATALDPAVRGRQGKIQHVVFIIQENRSFNYLFRNYPNAVTADYGYDETGKKIHLHPQTMSTSWDIDHSLTAFLAVYDNGKLDGWNEQNACCAGNIPKNFAYSYAPADEVRPYWNLAGQYVLADNMFQSNIDGSFVSHQYAIGAYANHTVDFTSGLWGCPGGPADQIPTITQQRTYGPNVVPCFDNTTIGDEADAAGVTWRFYAGTPSGDGGIWSSYQAINHIYNGPDWATNVISPPAQFLTDIAGGQLANITWITPTLSNSDHPGIGFGSQGPQWVTSLVNAIGKSPDWDSTAIFIMWDDWGGWFDPVAPPYVDYDGLGFRVPLIIVSPYAKAGYVTHIQYETSSVLRFMEDTFGLGRLAASDRRAADPGKGDVFDFSAPPRAFVPFRLVAHGGAPPTASKIREYLHGSPAGGD